MHLHSPSLPSPNKRSPDNTRETMDLSRPKPIKEDVSYADTINNHQPGHNKTLKDTHIIEPSYKPKPYHPPHFRTSNTGQIVGITFGCLILACLVLGLAACCRNVSRERSETRSMAQSLSVYEPPPHHMQPSVSVVSNISAPPSYDMPPDYNEARKY